jgi:hypothetical protein
MAFDRFTRRAMGLAALVAAAAGAMTGCDRGSLHDSLTYCNYLADHLADLGKVPVTRSDIDAEVMLMQSMHAKAPVAVDEQWAQIAGLVKEAASVDLNDPVGRQQLTNDAYAAERSMREISDHAGAVCGLKLPAVGAVQPDVALPAPPTSTKPPAATAASPASAAAGTPATTGP